VLFEAKPASPYQYTKVDYINGSATKAFPDVDTPGSIAVDQTGMAWVPSTGTGEIGNAPVSFKNGGETSNPSEATGPQAYSLASDGNSNIWITANTADSLAEVPSGATSPSGSAPYITGGGMNEPYKLVVDGANTIWIANDGANTVSAYSPSGSGAWLATNGFSTSAASGVGAVVIGVDGSGNVWTGNTDGSVTQLLGLATPTATPFYGGMTVTTTIGSNQTTVITPGNLGSKP
jgi:hypothetical protein